jgi:hypothetical protein
MYNIPTEYVTPMKLTRLMKWAIFVAFAAVRIRVEIFKYPLALPGSWKDGQLCTILCCV